MITRLSFHLGNCTSANIHFENFAPPLKKFAPSGMTGLSLFACLGYVGKYCTLFKDNVFIIVILIVTKMVKSHTISNSYKSQKLYLLSIYKQQTNIISFTEILSILVRQSQLKSLFNNSIISKFHSFIHSFIHSFVEGRVGLTFIITWELPITNTN